MRLPLSKLKSDYLYLSISGIESLHFKIFKIFPFLNLDVCVHKCPNVSR